MVCHYFNEVVSLLYTINVDHLDTILFPAFDA